MRRFVANSINSMILRLDSNKEVVKSKYYLSDFVKFDKERLVNAIYNPFSRFQGKVVNGKNFDGVYYLGNNGIFDRKYLFEDVFLYLYNTSGQLILDNVPISQLGNDYYIVNDYIDFERSYIIFGDSKIFKKYKNKYQISLYFLYGHIDYNYVPQTKIKAIIPIPANYNGGLDKLNIFGNTANVSEIYFDFSKYHIKDIVTLNLIDTKGGVYKDLFSILFSKTQVSGDVCSIVFEPFSIDLEKSIVKTGNRNINLILT